MIAAAFLRDFVKGMFIEKLGKSVSGFYERLKNKDDLYQRIKDYQIKNERLGIDGTVEKLAKQYNVDINKYLGRLSEYLKGDANYLNSILGNLKSKLGPASLGKNDAELYAFAKKADDLVSRLVGYAASPEAKQKAANYLNDNLKKEYIGSAYHRLRNISEHAKNAKDDHPFAYGAFKKVSSYIISRALAKRGLEGTLESAIGVGRKLKESASPVLKDYHEIIKSFYGGDLRNGVYA